jgi:hypothetical protein
MSTKEFGIDFVSIRGISFRDHSCSSFCIVSLVYAPAFACGLAFHAPVESYPQAIGKLVTLRAPLQAFQCEVLQRLSRNIITQLQLIRYLITPLFFQS